MQVEEKVKESKRPVCRECEHIEIIGRAHPISGLGGLSRAKCYCNHPQAEAVFQRVCPRSSKAPGFIDYTSLGGDKPVLKTSPRWCPLREH